MKPLTSLIVLTIFLIVTFKSSYADTLLLPQNINCTTDFDCPREQFCLEGGGHCTCLDSYTLNLNPNPAKPGSPVCIKTRVLDPDSTTSCTSSSSSSSSQCIINAECNTGTGKCSCKDFGIKLDSSWLCLASCSSDADCRPYHNVECKAIAGGASEAGAANLTKGVLNLKKCCDCKSGFSRDSSGTCTRSLAPIGGRCETDPSAARKLRCGDWAVCSENTNNKKTKTCVCQVFAMPDKANGANCLINNCTTDADCLRVHANTVCKVDREAVSNVCKCAANFVERGDGCFLKEGISRLGDHCTKDGDCSHQHAQCTANVCRCRGGSRPAKDGVNCSPVSCTKQEDCTAENKAWTCNEKSHQCYNPNAAFGFKSGGTLLSLLFLLVVSLFM